ncbi:MAG TPA: MlaD family protein [Fibrobacteria bacterium]|jgi:phospholipid/cholesterol/gamma-HCH transport system substrate-binding protein|nr:MlaD family protein [Fibrobacteria bacterium]
MTSSRTQNTVVGAFVVGALAVLIGGVYFLKERTPGQSSDAYFAKFEQVSTLQEGDPVKVNGVKSGRVTSIALEGRSVRVGFTVDRGVRLPKDSEVRIQNIGLMGERQLGVRMGAAAEFAEPGSTFDGTLDAGIAEAMGAAGEAIAEAEALVRSVRAAVDGTIGKPEFAGRVNNLLATAEGIAARMDKLAADVDPQVREGARSFRATGKIAEDFARRQTPRLDRMAEDGAEAAARARALAERGEKAAQSLEEILAKLNAGRGTAGALLNDTTLHRDLTAAVRSADSLFRSMRTKGLDVNVDLF